MIVEMLPTAESKDTVIELKAPQDGYVYTDARYPAFVGGWGTGKSMAMILRANRLSEEYPGNLGIIFRKEAEDLKTSTLIDFQNLTGIEVSSRRDVVYPNGSRIFFLHLEELNNIQNMNLGWFAIEQAEEFETEEQYLKLFGRLRRKNCVRSGFIAANTNGHNWIWRMWKMGGLVESIRKAMTEHPEYFADIKTPEEAVELYEMSTWENEDVLAPDFLGSLKVLEIQSPKLYNRFVGNSWDDSDAIDTLIPAEWVDLAMSRISGLSGDVYLGVDVARFGDDRTVIFPIKGRIGLPPIILYGNDTMKVCGRIGQLYAEMGAVWIGIDSIGIGAGVYDRLNELGLPVHEINVSEKSDVIDSKTNKPKFKNLRSQLWWMARESLDPRPEMQAGPVSLPKDSQFRDELVIPKYTINSAGQIEVEPKDDMKERLGHSPDIADAYCIACYGALGGIPEPFMISSRGNLLNSRGPSWL